jgi:UDP:flavonoid glycosyltransferase YjiC (YdhE family)
MLALAKAFQRAGADVTMGCSAAFENVAAKAGVGFWEVNINRNANTGIVSKTPQDKSEAKRIAAFVEATRSGAAATLIFQAEHRKADMLADPKTLQEDILHLVSELQPDLFVVDQLSYGVTLVLHGNTLPFLTFCPGHPTYIPSEKELFGVPYAWPAGFQVEQEELEALTSLARSVDRKFTNIFNQSMKEINPALSSISSAFRLHSPLAILFNYPDFGHLHQAADGVKKFYLGACFSPQALNTEWTSRLAEHAGKQKILISLGTFLSARADVLEKLILGVKKHLPDVMLYVAAGASKEMLAGYECESIAISEFLPQVGLLPHVDLVIHHGGNNSFTETLHFGKPAIILPFSSDQFAIAHDLQRFSLGRVLDPNGFTEAGLQEALDWALGPGIPIVLNWRASNPPLGTAAAAAEVLSELKFIGELHPFP